MNISGYYKECLVIMAQLNMDENLALTLTKKQWKIMVSKKIKNFTRDTLIERAKPYKKIDFLKMRNEMFELKGYFKSMNLSQARMMFSLQVKTTRNIKYHRMNDK